MGYFPPDSPLPDLAYVEFTAAVDITATVEASADVIVSAGALTLDGSTDVWVEFVTPAVRPAATSGANLSLWLFDGSTSLGRVGLAQSQAASNANRPMTLRRRLSAPSAAAHTYSIRGTVTTGTGVVTAGAGGAGDFIPGHIRVTRA